MMGRILGVVPVVVIALVQYPMLDVDTRSMVLSRPRAIVGARHFWIVQVKIEVPDVGGKTFEIRMIVLELECWILIVVVMGVVVVVEISV
jgi:hypothetical protein